jgi:hypothetical protein
MNYLPLPNLDGYVVVCHVLGVLDLARESGRYVRAVVRGDGVAATYPGRLRAAYLGYLAVAGLLVAGLTALVLWAVWLLVPVVAVRLTVGAVVVLVGLLFVLRAWGAHLGGRAANRQVQGQPTTGDTT